MSDSELYQATDSHGLSVLLAVVLTALGLERGVPVLKSSLIELALEGFPEGRTALGHGGKPVQMPRAEMQQVEGAPAQELKALVGVV